MATNRKIKAYFLIRGVSLLWEGYHTVWRTCFGKGWGPTVRQTTEWMN